MKLFLWEDVLCDYTSGIMGAVAETKEDAIKALLKECPYIDQREFDSPHTEHELTEAKGFYCWGGS